MSDDDKAASAAFEKFKSAMRKAMVKDARLSRAALALGLMALERLFADVGYFDESIDRLQAKIGVSSRRTVQRGLAALDAAVYVRVQRPGSMERHAVRIFLNGVTGLPVRPRQLKVVGGRA